MCQINTKKVPDTFNSDQASRLGDRVRRLMGNPKSQQVRLKHTWLIGLMTMAIIISVAVLLSMAKAELGQETKVNDGWITKWHGKETGTVTIMDMADGSIGVGRIKEENGSVEIDIYDTYYTNHDCRIIAISKWMGKTCTGELTSEIKTDKGARFNKAKFDDISLKRIKEFRFQIRPKQKTAVQVEGEESTSSNLVWGEEVNGLRAAMEFMPEKKSYSLGERVEVRFHIQNVSNHDIQIATTKRRQDHAFVQDDDGKEISVSKIDFLWRPHIVHHILKPRETVVLKSVGLGFGKEASLQDVNTKPLTGNFILCGPGSYFIHYQLRFPDITREDAEGKVVVPQPDDWRGFLETGNRRLVITSTKESEQQPAVQVEGDVLQGSCEVSGTVYDPVPDSLWEDVFAKLEAAESVEEFEGFLKNNNIPHPDHPAAGVVVALRGSSLTKETVTDAEGKFKFTGLPEGAYDLSCEKTVTSTRTGEKRMAVAKNGVQFKPNSPDRGRTVDLRFHDDYITVKGRITDVHGRPIASAEVVGTAAPLTLPFEAWSDHSGEGPRTVSTVSRADGSYELSGLDPPNLIALTRYLANGSPGDELGYGFFLDITIRTDGFGLSKDDVTRVPLVTEELLYLARRLFKAHTKVVRRTGGEEIQEKQDFPYPFPSSHGNTITDIDIVLEHTGTDVQVEGGTRFGPEVKRILGLECAWIDLESGTTPIPPSQEISSEARLPWCRERGIDAVGKMATGRLDFLDVEMVKLSDQGWTGLSVDGLRRALQDDELIRPSNVEGLLAVALEGKSEKGTTYGFRTREGSPGLLKIDDFWSLEMGYRKDNPGLPAFITILYKLALSPEMAQTVILERPLSLSEQQYLDLDSGEYVFMPGENANPEHLRNQGVDIYLTVEKPTASAPPIAKLNVLGMATGDAPHKLYLQQVPADSDSLSIAIAHLNKPKWLMGYSAHRAHIFRTAQGKVGAMKIKWVSEDPAKCVLQYKFLPELDIPIEKFPWVLAAEGVQSRLRARKTTWKAEEIPTLSLDLRNVGSEPIDFCRIAQAHCEIEVDGQWYGWAEPLAISAPVWMLEPGTELNAAIEITLTDSRALPKDGNKLRHRPGVEEFWGKQLELTPGKHTVRIRFRHQAWMEGYLKGENDLFIISNSVEIEILAEDNPAVEVLLSSVFPRGFSAIYRK